MSLSLYPKGTPNICSGNYVSKITLDNSVEACAFSSSQYVKDAIENNERNLNKKGLSLKKKDTALISANCCPEIDGTTKLNDNDASYYQSLICILRWIVELGRMDICYEFSILASHMVLPCIGHMERVLHIFSYLRPHHNTVILFDPSEPEFDMDVTFPRED